jgi:hypothetical protein
VEFPAVERTGKLVLVYFEISSELKASNTALFGGTVSSQYRIFTTEYIQKPAPITSKVVSRN